MQHSSLLVQTACSVQAMHSLFHSLCLMKCEFRSATKKRYSSKTSKQKHPCNHKSFISSAVFYSKLCQAHPGDHTLVIQELLQSLHKIAPHGSSPAC